MPSPPERVSRIVAAVWRSATTASPTTDGKRSTVPTMRAAICSPSISSGMMPRGPAAATTPGVARTRSAIPSVGWTGRNVPTRSVVRTKPSRAGAPPTPPVPVQRVNACGTRRPSTRGRPNERMPFADGWMPVPAFAVMRPLFNTSNCSCASVALSKGIRPRSVTVRAPFVWPMPTA